MKVLIKFGIKINFKNKFEIKDSRKRATVILLVVFLLFFSFLKVKATSDEDKTKEKLRDELTEIEEDLEKEQQEETTLSGQLDKIENNISQIRAEISQTSELINKFQKDINEKEQEIEKMEKNIKKQKENIAIALRQFDRSFKEIDLFFLNSQNDIGSYFNYLERIQQIQVKFEKMIREIKTERDSLNDEKKVVEEKKEKENSTLILQREQKRALEDQEASKQFYLDKTHEKIDLLNIKRVDLRRQLNALQSLGTAIDLDDAIKVAQYASKKTGVRVEFLLGVLRVESNMGQNVGGGTYKKDMNPNQRDIFKDICEDLGYKAKEMPVSKRVCYNPNAVDGCGGWGGAMGPAQFMPSTWMGYKDRVEDMTGHKPADPWDLKDSLVAMGLKLAAVDGVTKHKKSAEKQAAAMYLAGGAWEGYLWYGDRVLEYADMFEKYIKDND